MTHPLEGRARRRPLWPWLILMAALFAAVAAFFVYVPR